MTTPSTTLERAHRLSESEREALVAEIAHEVRTIVKSEREALVAEIADEVKKIVKLERKALAIEIAVEVMKLLVAQARNLSRLLVLPLRFSPEEIAEQIGIKRRTLTDWMRKRLIPFERIGPKKGRSTVLFERDDVDKALKRWRVKSVGE